LEQLTGLVEAKGVGSAVSLPGCFLSLLKWLAGFTGFASLSIGLYIGNPT
jgi:hypothetical protein